MIRMNLRNVHNFPTLHLGSKHWMSTIPHSLHEDKGSLNSLLLVINNFKYWGYVFVRFFSYKLSKDKELKTLNQLINNDIQTWTDGFKQEYSSKS